MKNYELFFNIEFLDGFVLTQMRLKPILQTGMTQLKKFEDLNG
jgi:hypothetical protein